MNVTLPSGRVAPLEPADLQRLLACGGTRLGLCEAVWAHPGVEAARLAADPADAFYVASWAIEQFIATDEAAELAAVCQEFGESPSARIGMNDRVLEFALDQGCLVALMRAREGESPREPAQFNVNGGEDV